MLRFAIPSLRIDHTIRLSKPAFLLVGLTVLGSGFSYRASISAKPGTKTIYVSPSGSDRNSGTQSHPLKTLVRAQKIARSTLQKGSGGVTVNLESGTYRLAHTLTFNSTDSGHPGHLATWAAAPGATPVISGALRITHWKLADSKKQIWQASVPKSLNTRQLYVNGVRAFMPAGQAPVKLSLTKSGYHASSGTMAHWRNPSSLSFVYTSQAGLMIEPICPVRSIKGKNISMAQPCWNNSNKRVDNLVGFGKLGLPTYIENAYELLVHPGQFYLDRASHTMYYIPRNGQDMRTADVEAPRVETLVSGNGSASAPIRDLTFRDLQFAYTTWVQPGTPTGFSDLQSGFSITGKHGYASEGLCHLVGRGTCPYGNWTPEPAAVQFAFDQHLKFFNNRFVHLGAAGLALGDGSQAGSVSSSVFTDMSGNGIDVGGVDLPKAKGAAQTKSMNVSNNHLYDLGLEFHGAVGIWVGYAANSVVSHNQIDHVPYSGISIGWGGWLDKRGKPPVASFSRNNTVSDNLIYDFMQTLSDGGGIYTQGITGSSMANGEKVSGNVIHDQLAWGRALQSDDGATFVTYSGNVLYNDNYDWGSNHVDYVTRNGKYDPQRVAGNYWQQGDPNNSKKGVTETGNKLIAGPSGAPASVLNSAGVEEPHHAILDWSAAGMNVPNPPESVATLYAFGGKAYVTWRPSLAAGSNAISSYTVTACRAKGSVPPASCRPSGNSKTISANAFNRVGFAVISGLKKGASYSFDVVANGTGASSTPAPQSRPVTVKAHGPRKPGKPRSLKIRTASGLARLLWYTPASARNAPVLSFVITLSNGKKYDVRSLRQSIVSNNGGHVIQVLSGLSGQPYKFSVACVDPAGIGPSASVTASVPK